MMLRRLKILLRRLKMMPKRLRMLQNQIFRQLQRKPKKRFKINKLRNRIKIRRKMIEIIDSTEIWNRKNNISMDCLYIF